MRYPCSAHPSGSSRLLALFPAAGCACRNADHAYSVALKKRAALLTYGSTAQPYTAEVKIGRVLHF